MDPKELKALRRPFLKALFRNNKFNLTMTALSALAAAANCILLAWIIKEVTDLIAGASRFSIGALLLFGVIALALYGVSWLLDWLFLSEFKSKAMKQYRDHVFDRLMEKGIRAFSGENSSLYLSALSNDVNTIETDFISQLRSMIRDVISLIGALILMLSYSPLLTLIAIGLSLLPLAVSVLLGDRSAKAVKELSNQKEKYTGLLKDVLTGFSVIKSFKAERSMARLHDQSNTDTAGASKKRVQVGRTVAYTAEIAAVAMQLGVFFIAVALSFSGRGITPGMSIAFVELLNYVVGPVQTFPEYYAGAKASFGLIDKLTQALDKNVADEGEDILPILVEGISLRDLKFSYGEDKTVLDGVNMEMRTGGCYVLVGSSGSGKSTILNLLMASTRDYEGQILYDGKELKTVSTGALYDLVSIIQQDVFVFNSTVRDNITLFSAFPENEIHRAARLSGLEKLMEEKGADYLCGENGCGLSGGERQRVSIARALLRKTPVLLVDEATASLDARTSHEVLDAILDLDGYTRVIVLHGLDESILRRCTGIFTLKNGVVAEQGTFDKLIDRKGYFYSLYTVSQGE